MAGTARVAPPGASGVVPAMKRSTKRRGSWGPRLGPRERRRGRRMGGFGPGSPTGTSLGDVPAAAGGGVAPAPLPRKIHPAGGFRVENHARGSTPSFADMHGKTSDAGNGERGGGRDENGDGGSTEGISGREKRQGCRRRSPPVPP
ncbi:circumsporozoite protein-like [Grus americana]|uniref:circumsporozoite protein-like n=1 Tax=Grus americana TaxID=9117 RepID=UPI0024086044|nr:circumsporozoite protein-like [Grus americana]XP_054674453.1 circumsporozoite protein-like [Grus americana]